MHKFAFYHCAKAFHLIHIILPKVPDYGTGGVDVLVVANC